MKTVNAGMVSMAQNTNTGLSAITLQYAIHGADEGSAGRVDYSTNGGSTWIKGGNLHRQFDQSDPVLGDQHPRDRQHTGSPWSRPPAMPPAA